MTPSVLLMVPAVASGIGLPLLEAPQPPDLATAIQQFASQFATETAVVLSSVNSAVLDIARVAYVTCLLVGVLLYFTHLGRRLGKDLIVGGVLLVVITEYVIPRSPPLQSSRGGVREVVPEDGDHPSQRGDLLSRLQ